MLYIFTPVFCVALCVGAVFSFSNNRVYGAATVKSNGAYLNLSGGANILNGFEGAQKETLYLGKYNNAPVKWRVLAKNDTKYGSGENNLLLFADSVLGTTVYNDTTYGGDYYGTSKLRALLNGGYYIKPNADCDVSAVTSYMTESSAYASTLFAGLNDDLVMTAKDIVTHDSHFTRSAWFEDPKVNPWMRTVGNDLYTSDASIITSKNILYLTTNIAGKSINTKTGKTADPNFSVNYSVANGIAETTKGDKLFPLDYDDIVNKTYGFVDASGKTYLDKLGSTYASNYASKGYKYGYPSIHEGEVKYAQFKPTGSGSYWLRMSAKVFDSWENGAFYVNANGEITASLYSVEGTGALAVQGVRPAFVLDATKLAYVTTATPTAGSGFVKLATTQTTPTYKIYVKDTNFSTFSSSAKGNVKEDNGNLSITYNNPTGETGGNLLVLLSPKSAEGGEVDYQAAVAMSSTASATKQAATTLKLPDNVSLSTHNLTVLYTSATSANATENIYCTYPADGGIDTPADFNAGKFNDASKWISDLQEGDRPSWWNSDIYGDTPYMSVDSVEYTPIKGNKTNVTTAAIKDAGSYKVTFKLASGLTWSDGSTSNKSFTISVAQAESSIVPQYANAPTYVPDELPAISQKAGGTPGTIKWDDGQHPQSGTKNYTWTFTPENENNYTTIKSSKEFTFAAREVESVTIKSFDTKGKTIYTNTSAATLKTYMTVEVKFVGIAEKVELDPGDYDLQINANNKLVKGSNKLKVKYTTSDNKTKYSAEYTISDVEELTYKTITNIVLGNDEFTYPVKASDILAEIISVDVEMNDGSSGELTADEILTLMELEGDLTVDTTSVTFKIKDTEAETDYPVTIKKGTYNMSGITFADSTVTYDGDPHSIAISGTLPEGVTVKYYKADGSTEFTGATAVADSGTVIAKFTGDSTNYNAIPDKTATLTVKQAKVTGIVFEGDSKPEITGQTYTLEATGVPSWVTVSYSVEGQSGTSFSDAGTYKFTATFTHSDPNYEQLAPMTATLIISDKPPVEGAENIVVQPTIKVTYGSPVDYAAKNVPAGVGVSYVILKDGAPFSGTEIKDVGEYTITVSFTVAADKAPIADKTCVVTINKAEFDIEDYVTFSGKTVAYDGSEYTLAISGDLPDWITVSYEVEGQDGKSFSAVGTYNFVAHFTHENDNYEEIGDMPATLKITTAALTLDVAFEDNTVTYNGETHKLEITGELPVWVEKVTYYVGEEEFTGAVNAGTYTVTAKFTVDTALYEQPEEMTATLKIEAAVYELTGVTFENGSFVYDGESHSIFVGGTLPDWITVSYTGNEVTEIGTHTVTAKFEHADGNYLPIADMTAQIIISKAKVALPVYKNTLSYTGGELKPTAADFEGFDSALMSFVEDKTIAGLNAGTYKAVFALTDTDRYEWATATTLKKALFAVVYDEVVLEDNEAAVDWNIAKAKISATKANGKLPVFASESFNGSLADIVGLKYYTDETCAEEISADELAYGTKYYVKAELLDGSNFELDETAMAFSKTAFEYTTPEKQLTIWEKIVKFVTVNWLWLVIAVVALILFIVIIALIARAAKKKREREERRLAEEKAERERREEREEQRRREDREERMARMSQQQMMMPQMMPQMPQQMPMPQSMPAAQPMAAGGGSSNEIAELKAEMAAMKASQDMAKELAIRAEMAAREMALRAEQNAVMRSDINALRGGEQTSGIIGISMDKLTELVEKTVERVLGKEKPAAEKAGDGAATVPECPPDAVMTTVTTTKIDTTKKPAQPAQNAQAAAPVRTVVRNVVAPMPVDDGRVFDVGGFYKPADPVTDMGFTDDENKD